MTTSDIYANPWLPAPGKWKYYFDITNHNISKNLKQDREKYFSLEKEIIQLYDAIDKINLKTALAKDQSKIGLDKSRLEDFKNHRISYIKNYIKQLKILQESLYHDYNLWHMGQGVEYGYNEYLSYGIESDYGKLKNSNSSNIRVFTKHKILHKDNYILSLKPHLNLGKNHNIIGADIIFGSSKMLSPKKFRLETEIFQYSSIGINKHIGSTVPGYRLENSSGIRLKSNILLIFQTINELQPGFTRLYNNILKKHFKIAKELEINDSKLSLNIGYFTIKSLSSRKYLGSGYGVGLWLEM